MKTLTESQLLGVIGGDGFGDCFPPQPDPFPFPFPGDEPDPFPDPFLPLPIPSDISMA